MDFDKQIDMIFLLLGCHKFRFFCASFNSVVCDFSMLKKVRRLFFIRIISIFESFESLL